MHRLALAPFLESEQQVNFPAFIAESEKEKGTPFLQFLISNGLAPLWHETLSNSNLKVEVNSIFIEKLWQVRLTAEANFLMQEKTLQKLDDVFTSYGIEYAVFKGAHIRDVIYEIPALRPANDLDILVSKQNRDAAILALTRADMIFKPISKNISHESTIIDGAVNIDLHWEIMRPGRTQIDLTQHLLHTKRNYLKHWGFGIEETLFVMLIHPVFTKYLTSPNYPIIGILDFIKWMNRWDINWDKVYELCCIGGVKTAVWLSGEWIKLLTGITISNELNKRIEPNNLQAKYLRNWLIHNYSTRFFKYPMLNQVLFTLPVHDKPSHIIGAVRKLCKEKWLARKNMNRLIKIVTNDS